MSASPSTRRRERYIDHDVIAPVVDDDGKPVLNGFFTTEPTQVFFDLKFIPSDGEWKLLGVNANRAPGKKRAGTQGSCSARPLSCKS